MSIKRWLVHRVPRRYELPLRYYYRMLKGRLERELAVVRELVQGGDTAVDVGASYGLYTYLLSRICRRVEAFEPIPRCAEVLRAYGAANVRVHEVALSSAAGVRVLHIPTEGDVQNVESASFKDMGSIPATVMEVPIRTLDDFDFRDVSFVKIDVEGHELEVLRGARTLIERDKPVLLIEIEQRHLEFPMQDVLRHVVDLGYHGWFVDRRRLRPVAEFCYEVHQEPYLHELPSKRCVNNFLFLPGPSH